MNPDHDDHGLTTALRDCLEEVRPDLDRLVSIASRQGTRIRRRTRFAVSLGGVAAVAVVAAAVAASPWSGSSPSGTPRQAGFADEPSFSSSFAPGPSAVTTTPLASTTLRPHQGEPSPVTVEVSGWSCTPPADEKFICSSGGQSVQITWRPADERPDWGNNPDKSADWISAVHGQVFVTVDAGPGTPATTAVTVGQALAWS